MRNACLGGAELLQLAFERLRDAPGQVGRVRRRSIGEVGLKGNLAVNLCVARAECRSAQPLARLNGKNRQIPGQPEDRRLSSEHDVVGTPIVIAAIEQDEIGIEIVVVLQREAKRKRAFAVPSKIRDRDRIASGAALLIGERALEIERVRLVALDTVAERGAPAEYGDAALARTFASNPCAPIAPHVVSARGRRSEE